MTKGIPMPKIKLKLNEPAIPEKIPANKLRLETGCDSNNWINSEAL
jgi:hypothetical protein